MFAKVSMHLLLAVHGLRMERAIQRPPRHDSKIGMSSHQKRTRPRTQSTVADAFVRLAMIRIMLKTTDQAKPLLRIGSYRVPGVWRDEEESAFRNSRSASR